MWSWLGLPDCVQENNIIIVAYHLITLFVIVTVSVLQHKGKHNITQNIFITGKVDYNSNDSLCLSNTSWGAYGGANISKIAVGPGLKRQR